ATLFAKKGHVLFTVDENDGLTAKVANDVSRNIKSITRSAMDDFVKEYMKPGGPDKFYMVPGLTESELRKLFSVGCVNATASDYFTDNPKCSLYIVANNNAKNLPDSWWKKLAERTQNATDNERYQLNNHELSYAGAVVDYDISNGAAKKKLSYVGGAD
ncbi:MAG: hypothetical protein J6A01_12245, partial [Proteobacteria bacterium]|nr:hypothetical protein [Pseudomonadota bacterium]